MSIKEETMQEYGYYVGGKFKKSRDRIEVINPVTEELCAHIFETTKDDLEFAIQSGRSAQKEWKKTPFKERANVLREIAKTILGNLKELAELEAKEIGKPFKEPLFVDIPLGADCFNYYASLLDSLEEESIQSDLGIDLIRYEPFGVAGIYLPYNVPLMTFGFSCAAALAAGNALIIKPSEYGSLSLLGLAQYIDTLDTPKGLINVVTGRGESMGKLLAESTVDMISFTGSRDTLKKIIARSKDVPKKIICELGGCNFTVVFSDADKEEAIQNILGSSFMKQGQMCVGTSVVLIQDSVYDDIVGQLKKRALKIQLGDPFDPMVGMGPLPTREHLENIHQRVKGLQVKGAKIICGAKSLNQKGYFYPPTIIETKEALYEEFFAPVILIKRFRTRLEVEEIIEKNPTGLVMQIWTKDIPFAEQLAQKASCGTVWINTFVQMSSQTPFGGMRSSGWGRNLGKFGFFEYIQPKHIGIGFKKSPVSGWFGI
ncbi:MAG: aldehyde dehydrogenase [Candidatus Omnitrophota bacterium]|nr:MAG: aldehyde dehydrogenase [Candidatus Omnitrophota bacterium]